MATAAKLLASAVACTKSKKGTKFSCRKVRLRGVIAEKSSHQLGAHGPRVFSQDACVVHAHKIKQPLLTQPAALSPASDQRQIKSFCIYTSSILSPPTPTGQKPASRKDSYPPSQGNKTSRLQLWETAREEIKGSAECKQLQLQPPAELSDSEQGAEGSSAWGHATSVCQSTMLLTCGE